VRQPHDTTAITSRSPPVHGDTKEKHNGDSKTERTRHNRKRQTIQIKHSNYNDDEETFIPTTNTGIPPNTVNERDDRDHADDTTPSGMTRESTSETILHSGDYRGR